MFWFGFSVALINTMAKSSFAKARVYSTYTSALYPITEGSQKGTYRQELKQRLREHCLPTGSRVTLSYIFLIPPRTTSSGAAPSSVDLALPCVSSVKKMPSLMGVPTKKNAPTGMPTSQSEGGKCSGISSSQICLHLCQGGGKNPNQHTDSGNLGCP